MRLLKEFEDLRTFLFDNGYTVIGTIKPQYKFMSLQNTKGITGGFLIGSDDCNRYIHERIAVDNSKCFDKWSKCPLIMSLDGLDKETLLKHLLWLGSEEGYHHSNSYEYFDKRILPMEII